MLDTPSPPVPSPRRQRLHPRAQQLGYWLNGLAIGLFLAWLAGKLAGRFYFFELFTHFQTQYYGLAMILVVAGFISRMILGKPGSANLTIIPFLVFSGIRSFENPTWVAGDYEPEVVPLIADVRIFHANVLYTRTDYEPTLALLRRQQPDLYVLQEMTPASIRLVTRQLSREYPYWFACWSKGPCWVLVGSRNPIRVDDPLAKTQRIIALTTQVRGQPVGLVTVHPRTPLLPSWFEERNSQLTNAAQRTRSQALPTVLVGDFNISVFSPLYKTIFRPVERSSERPAIENPGNLRSARRALTQPTWPSFFSPMMIPIDHVFTNGGFRPFSFQTLAHPGSDHRAVVADLSFSR